jgi:peptidoglycan hydrolase-like protein with peptidoglycan-binding domain
MQKILIAKGYLKIASPTGVYGPLTVAAVKKYQAANGIPVTGNVFSLTRTALNAGK